MTNESRLFSWLGCLVLSLVLSASCASDTSSSGGDAPDLRPMADPSSGSALRARIGAAGEEPSSSDEAEKKERKPIKNIGILEGRKSTVQLMTKDFGRKADEENWSYLGANPKKLKHRRLDAVEVAERALEENQWMKPDGSLDLKGALKLVEAQEEREAAPDGRTVRSRIYSLEELDSMFPTEEGDVRLGKSKPEERNETVSVKRERWERSSHFVNMRKPGSKPEGLLTEDMKNYRWQKRNITLFVEGSVEARYAIELPVSATVGELKSRIWEWERHYRYTECGLQGKDKAEGFKLEKQELVHNSGLVGPDARTLLWYNFSDYDLIRVVPPFVESTVEQAEELQDWYHELCYWRERDKCFEQEEDSDDADPLYRAMKEAYLETSKRCFEDGTKQLINFEEYHAELMRNDPNLGMRPHPKMTPAWLAQRQRHIERIGSPEWMQKVESDMHAELEKREKQEFKPEEAMSIDVTEDLINDLVEEMTGGEEDREESGERGRSGEGVSTASSGADLAGAFAGLGGTFDIPQDILEEVRGLRRKRWRERAARQAGGAPAEEEADTATRHASEVQGGYDHPIVFD